MKTPDQIRRELPPQDVVGFLEAAGLF